MGYHAVPTIQEFDTIKGKEYRLAEHAGFIRPNWLTPDNLAAAPLGLVTLGAAIGATATTVCTVSADGPMDLEYIGCLGLVHNNISIDINYNGGGGTRNLTTRPLRLANIAGVGQLPFFLPEPLFLRPNESVTIRFINQAAVGTTVRFWFGGTRYYTRAGAPASLFKWLEETRIPRAMLTQPYLVSTVVDITTTIVLGATAASYFQVDADAYFEMKKITGMEVTVAGAVLTWVWNIVDADSGQTLMNNPLYSDTVGTAQLPYRLPHSWVINPNRKVLVNVWNTAGAIANVQIVFAGRRIFLK